ncbi:sulfatase [Halolamina sp. C58]|uniref:sulfatase n=1 Tax=Halolamina sp. C58 TaxID=3421640 RepID=UPI003EC155D9
MSILQRFPRLNNLWMDAKHRVSHRLVRREQSFTREFSVEDPRPVVVVVIDSLRVDHVSGFGYEHPTTPTLDGFDAAAFPNAKAPAPWTFPSVPSLLSGRYPHNHGGCFDTDPRDLSSEQFPNKPAPEVPMLPDLLSAAGYETAMVTAIPMAERTVGDRFDTVSVKYTDAEERVETAIDWLNGQDRPFLHLQLGDPHAPLDIPDRHRKTFDVPDVEGIEDWCFRETTDGEGFEAYRDARTRAYDASIRGADDALGPLFEELHDDAIVVVCSDHGEALWDHPELERELNDDPRGYYATDHGHSVFGELTDVPLWIRAPGVSGSTENVSLTDVVPTVLSLIGAKEVDEFDGDAIQGEVERSTPILCEETGYGYNQRAVWLEGEKGISVPETGEEVSFETTSDESAPRDGLTDTLEKAFSRFVFSQENGGEKMEVDNETKDRLEDLGYLE